MRMLAMWVGCGIGFAAFANMLYHVIFARPEKPMDAKDEQAFTP